MYIVEGTMYCPSGWEEEDDCYGSVLCLTASMAYKVAKDFKSNGGYGHDGQYIKGDGSFRKATPFEEEAYSKEIVYDIDPKSGEYQYI